MNSGDKFFRDILAIGGKGEFTKHRPAENPISRIIKHIQSLIAETKKAHFFQDDKSNIITRLILNEFSLYTKKEPISLSDYKQIIEAIAAEAKKMRSGIHLVIATLPVLWPDNLIHNVALYVQCGENCILHHFDKNIAADKDCRYEPGGGFYSLYGDLNESGASKYTPSGEVLGVHFQENYYNTEFSPDILLEDTAVSVEDINQFRGAIKLIVDQEEIFVVIEICLENKENFGIYYLQKLIEQLKKAGKSIPNLVSQVVTSHSTVVDKKRLVGTLTQADPSIKKYRIPRKYMANIEFGKELTLYFQTSKKIKLMDPDIITWFMEEKLAKKKADFFHLLTDINFLDIKIINKFRAINIKGEGDINILISCLEDREFLLKYLVANNRINALLVRMNDQSIIIEAEESVSLRWAARLGYEQLVKLLLTFNSINPGAEDNYAIHWAAANGHTNIVKILLANKAVNPGAGYYNALVLASKFGHADIVRLLLADDRVDLGNVINPFALQCAIRFGHLEVTQILLNDKRIKLKKNSDWPIFWASEYGHVALVKFFLAERIIDFHSFYRAIEFADKNGHTEVMKLLMADKLITAKDTVYGYNKSIISSANFGFFKTNQENNGLICPDIVCENRLL